MLSVAALTSTISLLEVPVAYFVDEKKWSRKKASIITALIAFVIGIPSALSLGASSFFTKLPLLGKGFLDMANIILGNYSLTIGAFFISLFVAYKWGVASVKTEIEQAGNVFHVNKIWSFLIRFICPFAILLIFIYIVITRNYF